MENTMEIREYVETDENGWVRCRVLSFLETAYFDDVHREKEEYPNPSIELVAEEVGQIIGLIDVELDTSDRKVCSNEESEGGMIWHVAVHPDHQRRGIATALCDEARQKATAAGANCFEAWTRDDEGTVAWYENQGFEQIDSYLHVYLNHEEAEQEIKTATDRLSVRQAFTHYTGEQEQKIFNQYDRVHRCQSFELEFT